VGITQQDRVSVLEHEAAAHSLLSNSRRSSVAAIVTLLAANLLLNLGASVCFKEGGTDAVHRWHYFVGGNVLGITATALMMALYKRMNANLATMLVSGGSGTLIQFAFWLLYRAPLTGLQVAGIAMTVFGMVIATGAGVRQETAVATQDVEAKVA
jgi:drug/metabolite transporter (DMT)-like permease